MHFGPLINHSDKNLKPKSPKGIERLCNPVVKGIVSNGVLKILFLIKNFSGDLEDSLNRKQEESICENPPSSVK